MELVLDCVNKRFRNERVETSALDRVSLDFPSGSLTTVVGASGCGKSTLISIAGLLMVPDAGTVSFDGVPVSRQSKRARFEFRRRNIAFIFQSFNLIDELTVRENVMLPARYLGFSRQEQEERADRVLQDLGMSFRAHHYPPQLSGGQRQRVAIARGLTCEPRLILADEPTGNLDHESRDKVIEALRLCRTRGTTVIIVTHDPVIARIGDEMVEMRAGEVHARHRAAGQTSTIRSTPVPAGIIT